MEKQKTSVFVAGKEYTVVSSDPPEYLRRVAAYADRKLRESAAVSRLPLAQAGAWSSTFHSRWERFQFARASSETVS